VSLFLASRSSPSGKVVYLDFELRRQIFTMDFVRLEPDPLRFRDEVVRGAKIARALEASLVIDSVVPAVEALGKEKVLPFLRDFEPSGVDVYCTSLWYLPIGYRAVKVARSGERVMAAGYGVFLEMDISELVASVGGVRLGAVGRLQA
jgi:hypothetical protein